jgi:hypothetical protein
MNKQYKFLEKENWFKHDFRSREDKKLIRLKIKWKSSAPIGVFWQLCEMIYESGGLLEYDIDVIAYNCSDSVELVEDVIKMCFIITDDNFLTHETIVEQLDDREQLYQKSVSSGKKGADKRWGKDSNPIPTLSSPNSNPIGFDSRVESKEKREKSRELRDKNKLLTVYNAPVIQPNDIDYSVEEEEYEITNVMINKMIHKFAEEIDNRFKFNSFMIEVKEDYGGWDNLLNLAFGNDKSVINNFNNKLNEYRNGLFTK